MNNTLINALWRQPVEYTPIWIMRQAGRYLPEYRQLRAKAGDFLSLCKTPELACEVSLQPLRRFDLDAAILFSDILTIPDAMGLGLAFVEGEGPKFSKPLRDNKTIQSLSAPVIERDLAYVTDTIKLLKPELQVPLIGFSGSPWTLACYMVEGGSSKNFTHVKQLIYNEPEVANQLLQLLAQSVSDYLLAQIDAGADAVMLFDSWGGILTADAYQRFSLNYLQQIVTAIKTQRSDTPIILFTKGGGQWLTKIAQTGCQAVGLDWMTDIAQARQSIGHQVALQGNLDPAILYSKPAVIRQQVKQVLTAFGEGDGHVFNLGHGITPQVNPDYVRVLVDAVHEFSQR